MVRFGDGDGGRGRSRTAALVTLVAALMLGPPSQAMAQKNPASRHVITLTEVEKIEGGVVYATVMCGSLDRCEGSARITIRGQSCAYHLFGSASAARISLGMVPAAPTAPDLSDGRGVPTELRPIRITLESDGTGRRDVALAAVPRSKWERSETYSMMLPVWGMRIPVVNIRVTVHREVVTEQDR